MSDIDQTVKFINENESRVSRFHIYRTLFRGRNFIFMLLFGLIQQLIVASSVLFLADAAMLLTAGNNEDAVRSFVYFLIAMILPYIPGVLSQYYWQVWKATMVRDFQNFIIQNFESPSTSYANIKSSENVTSIFSNSVPISLNQVADYTYDLSQCIFNSLCGSIAVAAIVDPRLGAAYFFTVVFCAIYIHRFYSAAAAASETAERARIDLTTVSQRIWPNIILDNRLSLKTWVERLLRQHENTINAVKKEAQIRNVSNAILSLASVVPIVIVCTYLIYDNIGNSEYLSALFVTMPRMFSILALVSLFLFMIFDFSSVYGQIRVVEELFDEKPSVGKFDFERMIIVADGMAKKITCLQEFIQLCNNHSRITLRGENGVGKTSALLAAKQALGERAFYLPATSMLDLPSKLGSGSTGQLKRIEIEAVITDIDTGILLLDEWDANLDTENRNEISALIQQAINRGFTVVDISHR